MTTPQNPAPTATDPVEGRRVQDDMVRAVKLDASVNAEPPIGSAEERLIRACRAVDACASEFGLESGCCGEHLAELCEAMDALLGDGAAAELDAPTPLGALTFRMEQGGHTQSDLARLIGSRSRAAEILSGKRSMSKAQIATISDAWGIPARSLIGRPAEPPMGSATVPET